MMIKNVNGDDTLQLPPFRPLDLCVIGVRVSKVGKRKFARNARLRFMKLSVTDNLYSDVLN